MKQILIIDDDNLVRGMMAKAIQKAGYNVKEASDGNEGLQIILHYPIDLVITDMLMPDKEGVETIIEIREIRKDLKIVAMSSGGKKQDMTFLKMAEGVGANKLLKKPFRPSELLETIKGLLE